MSVEHRTKTDLLDMFLDRTAGEATVENRLQTRMNDNGNVELIAYGWNKLAEYDESRGVVTVFTGHRVMDSKTVNTYLNQTVRRAEARGRDVVISFESPNVAQPPGIVEYINHFINFLNPSKVDGDARDDVRDYLHDL